MSRRGDSYRTVGRFPSEDERRREWHGDRRGRRFSSDIPGPGTERARSPTYFNQSHSLAQRPRPNRTVSTNFDTSRSSLQLSEPSDFGVRTIQSSPSSPVFQAPSPAHHLDLHSHHRTDNSGKAPLANGSEQPPKATDPRLRSRSHQPATATAMTKSQATFISEGGSKRSGLGSRIQDLSNATASLIDIEKDHERLSSRQRRLKEEHQKCSRAFPEGNPYSKKIEEDLQAVKQAIEHNREQFKNSNALKSSALAGLAEQSEVHDAQAAEVLTLKGNLAEANRHAQDQQNAIGQLQQELKRMTVFVDTQEGQMKDIQEQFTDLKRLVSNANRSETSEIQELRTSLETQKLDLAEFHNKFAAQDSVISLNEKIDVISRREPIAAISVNSVTRAELDSYVAVFNKFESKNENRVQKLEEQLSKCESDLTQVSDFLKRVQEQAAKQEALGHLIQQHQLMEDKLKTISETTKTHVDKLNITEQSLKWFRHQFELLLGRVQKLEETSSQTNVTVLNRSLRTLDSQSKANTHSIKSLNQRFNNLTTDQLARQMVSALEPILTTIKPQMTELHSKYRSLQTIQDRFQDQQSHTTSSLLGLNTKVAGLQNNIERHDEVNTDLRSQVSILDNDRKNWETTVEKLAGLEANFQGLEHNLDAKVTGILEPMFASFRAGLHRDVNSEQGTKSAITVIKDDMQAKYDILLSEVKSARDEIDARLTIVENCYRGRQNARFDQSSVEGGQSLRNTDHIPTDTPAALSSNSTSTVRPLSGAAHRIQSTSSGGAKSMVRQGKAKSSQASPLVKYFPPSSDDGNVGDTIDATPQPKVVTTTKRIDNEVVSISDSDRESRSHDETEDIDDLMEINIDFEAWQKKSASENVSMRVPELATRKSSNSRPVGTRPVETVSSAKRKRPRSSVTLTSAREDRGSDSNGARSKSAKRKKARK